MFRCKECGCEYEEKPDYCDCGNDTFEEFSGMKQEVPPAKVAPVQQSEIIPEPKPFSEKNSEYERIKNSFDPISMTIFLLCIIASIVVLFFVGNPKEPVTQNPDTQPKEVQQINIPSIDSFWNNSTVGIINNEKSTPQTVVQNSQPQTANPLLALVEPVKTQTQVSASQTPAKNSQQKSQPQSAMTKIQQSFGLGNNSAKPQTPTPSQSKPKSAAPQASAAKIPPATQAVANQPKQSSQNKTPVTASSNNSVSQTPVSKPATTTQKVQTHVSVTSEATLRPKATIDTAALKKELDNYKIGLRNTIGRKVDFTRIIGDGECVVAFKVSSSGQLTNRSFSKQSSNITLNDAVYKAIMSTPAYNPPPSGYKNETLNLKVRFYNGNYDISLY